MSPVLAERFWSKVDVKQRLKCWEWKGAKDQNGYGQLLIDRKSYRAPRVAFWLRNGSWPINACHTCDNPNCCNPDHIFNGSDHDNMRDMVNKGRNKTKMGEEHPASRLTAEKVLAIRSDYSLGNHSLKALADKYGCGASTIQRVVSRTSWKHI